MVKQYLCQVGILERNASMLFGQQICQRMRMMAIHRMFNIYLLTNLPGWLILVVKNMDIRVFEV